MQYFFFDFGLRVDTVMKKKINVVLQHSDGVG